MKTTLDPLKLKPTSRADARAVGMAMLCLFLVSWAIACTEASAQGKDDASDRQVLARVDTDTRIETLGLPVYAHLADVSGQEYVLTIETLSRLRAAGRPYAVIDSDSLGKRYFLAFDRTQGVLSPEAYSTLPVLYNDGRRLILRAEPDLGNRLPALGFDLKLLGETPILFQRPCRETVPEAITPLPSVQAMMQAFSTSGLRSYVAKLSGVTAATIGGLPYTIQTRHTNSGVPIRKASQYVYEQLKNLGLRVSYHEWRLWGYSGRNVIGEIRGSRAPDEVVLVTAHLDDMPGGGTAPGADDNASGCAAALLAADIMKRYRFDRTVRFVFFTGEEQGLLGSDVYARDIADQTIVGVINMDMIAYNTAGSKPVLRLHTRLRTNPGYAADVALANRFVDVVQVYGLVSNLVPVSTADGENASDHSSFWDRGFAAILAIEDDYNDFNPYYHTKTDTQELLDFAYFTSFGKASLGTAAHLAGSPKPLPLRPDFIVTSIRLVPATPAPKSLFSARVTVKNRGTATGVGGGVEVWVHRSEAAACQATGSKRLSIGALDPGEALTLTFEGLTSGVAGAKTFRAFVDSGCETTEAVETNNQAVRPYNVR
jgi:hypothetical protein